MSWLVVAAVGFGVLAVVVLALTYGRRITRELDEERAKFLKPLEGHYVTVVVGDYKGVWRTLTGQLSSQQRSTETRPSRLSITLPNGSGSGSTGAFCESSATRRPGHASVARGEPSGWHRAWTPSGAGNMGWNLSKVRRSARVRCTTSGTEGSTR